MVSTNVTGQDDSLNTHRSDYDRRVEKYQKAWAKLIPTFVNVQFAGSMGFLSTGVGRRYGKKKQWETNALLGFLPKFSGHRANITFTAKAGYVPWDLHLKKAESFSIEPLNCGIYFTTILNTEDFWVKQSSRYPDGYYWFSSRLRLNMYIGQSLTYHIPENRKRVRRSVSFYYEISTNELYLITFIKNKTIPLKDIFHLSFGIRSALF
ncbi:MAG: hypothetical protein LBQ60_11805 [Bacteroidales bacterium]|jgi:hypothetical protein|nr:hypothetical protein [Bacteroidales bacterium]